MLGAAVAMVAALTAFAGASPAADAGGADAQATEEFRWSGTLEAGRTLEVNGVNGGIRAAPASGREVRITATKRTERGSRADLDEVEIRVLEHADGITVCVVYPGATGGGPDRCPGAQGAGQNASDVSVEFQLLVPSGVRFAGKTVNGAIQARDLDGDVMLRTVNGSIESSTAGSGSARTVNGNIRAVLGRLGGADAGDMAFETVNGSISVTLPETSGARVTLATANGEVRSEFPLTIPAGSRVASSRGGPRKLEGTIGDGGPAIELRSVNGSIELVQGR